ncbi:MAG: hypothetical protein ACR2OJ_03865 [Hyphomicrobiales bacterium]
MNKKRDTTTLDYAELIVLAGILHDALQSESKEGKTALAWLVRNCLDSGMRLSEIIGLLKAGMRARGDLALPAGVSFIYTVNVLTGVLADVYPDPTLGARNFHRHDAWPAWSQQRQPCALIGSYVYYK